MHTILTMLLDFIFPPTCPSCGRYVAHEGEWCESCFSYLYKPRYLSVETNGYLESCFTTSLYERGMRKIMQEIKFNGKKNKVKALAPFFDAFNRLNVDCDYVIPVPISQSQYKKRGYNQVELIFYDWTIGRNMIWVDILRKKDNTKPMWGLNKIERKQNIEEAYFCEDSGVIKGKSILLVDDIYTTGATLESIAQILHENGAKKIKALTITSGALEKISNRVYQ